MSYTKGLRLDLLNQRRALDSYGDFVAVFRSTWEVDDPESNARLFVAAGPLLEALELTACDECNNLIGWNGESPNGYDWRTCTGCKSARAAIALAKGEKP